MCTSKLKPLEEKGEETINKCLSYCKQSIICSGGKLLGMTVPHNWKIHLFGVENLVRREDHGGDTGKSHCSVFRWLSPIQSRWFSPLLEGDKVQHLLMPMAVTSFPQPWPPAKTLSK